MLEFDKNIKDIQSYTQCRRTLQVLGYYTSDEPTDEDFRIMDCNIEKDGISISPSIWETDDGNWEYGGIAFSSDVDSECCELGFARGDSSVGIW